LNLNLRVSRHQFTVLVYERNQRIEKLYAALVYKPPSIIGAHKHLSGRILEEWFTATSSGSTPEPHFAPEAGADGNHVNRTAVVV
jgi:hypothetical protein